MEDKKVTVGGQAVVEGVMMRGPKAIATAVRKQDGQGRSCKGILKCPVNPDVNCLRYC